jgi:hypothetical protein
VKMLEKLSAERRESILAAFACAVAPALMLSSPAVAQSQAVPMPAGAASGLPELKLSGRTRLTFFGLRVYDAQLWIAPGFDATKPTQTAFILDLTYLRNLKGKLIAERSLKEMQSQAPVSAEQAERWLAFMEKTFPDVGANDRLLGIHQPGQAARFVLNGREIGTLKDEAFSQRFFDIWLSPKGSEPAMREALLAGAK